MDETCCRQEVGAIDRVEVRGKTCPTSSTGGREEGERLERCHPQGDDGEERRRRLRKYYPHCPFDNIPDFVCDWENYVLYRKTMTLRRVTLEEEARRGRRRPEWEEEEEELPPLCPHPIRYNKYLWETDPMCPRCQRFRVKADTHEIMEMLWLLKDRDELEKTKEEYVRERDDVARVKKKVLEDRTQRWAIKEDFVQQLDSTRDENGNLPPPPTEMELKKAETEERRHARLLQTKLEKAEAVRVKKEATASRSEERKEEIRLKRLEKREEGREERDRVREEKKAATEERRQATLLQAKLDRAEVARVKKEATKARQEAAKAAKKAATKAAKAAKQ